MWRVVSRSGRVSARVGSGTRAAAAPSLPNWVTRDEEASMGDWQLDPYHTQVEFSAKHLGMMTVRGYFDEVSTTADIDPNHPETASVEATISTASIRTNNGVRDNDLRSSIFLEVEKYSVITFKSTS